MTDKVRVLKICQMCRHVRDHHETSYERWIPKEAYYQETGIHLSTCRLTFTICPICHMDVAHQTDTHA